jgi:O-antigen ligase
MARVAKRAAGPAWRVALTLLLVGLFATVSRGGYAGLALGGATLLVLGDWRAVVSSNWSIVLGAVVALACLAPSVPGGSQPHIILAILGLVLGSGLAQIRSWRTARFALPALVLAAAVAAVVLSPALAADFSKIGAMRLDPGSIAARQAQWAATVELIRSSPVVGVGPGHMLLHLTQYGFNQYAYFTHNEYLQLAAEQGLLGLGILVIGMGTVVVEIVRSGRRGEWLWAGGLAGFAGLALHSSFDFLWHVTVIPLAATVILAILSSDVQDLETEG